MLLLQGIVPLATKCRKNSTVDLPNIMPVFECRYDPHHDRWTGQPKLNRPRFALSAASAHGALYAVGGFNGEYYMSSIELYDPRVGRCCHLRFVSLLLLRFGGVLVILVSMATIV